MNTDSQPGGQVAQDDVETNRNNDIPPLPAHWSTNPDNQRRTQRTATEGVEPLEGTAVPRTTMDVVEAKCQQCVAWTKWAAYTLLSFLSIFAHFTTEFWHPRESHPPQRFRLHFWYACVVLLNRPSKYLGYLESFFDADQSSPHMPTIDRTPVVVRSSNEGGVYRRNAYTFGNEMSSVNPPASVRPTPVMTAEKEQELVERWNTQVIGRIATDWDQCLRLTIGLFAGSIASMQTSFISQSPLLMGNLFLIVAFSGLGCFSAWNRGLLENMKNMKTIKQWEPLVLPSFDPAVIGNEFECLALPEVYAMKAVFLTFILVFQAPFSYYGYQVEFGECPKLGFMISWCIILGWGAISVICGTRRMRAYGVKDRKE